MGRQDGVLKIKGELGGISFYKSKSDGYLARQKGGIDSTRLKTDPAFERTRENGAEFGRAGKAGKLLRTALRSLLNHTADSRMAGRLTREMLKVIRADATNLRGKRNVMQGNAALLAGFEFNLNAQLASTFFAPFTATVDRAAGTLNLTIPDFVPTNMIAAPAGATHFKLISAGAEIDFETGTYVVNTTMSEVLALLPQAIAVNALPHAVPAASTKPLFVAFGIEFYQHVNGEQYALKNGAHTALALVLVDSGK